MDERDRNGTNEDERVGAHGRGLIWWWCTACSRALAVAAATAGLAFIARYPWWEVLGWDPRAVLPLLLFWFILCSTVFAVLVVLIVCEGLRSSR